MSHTAPTDLVTLALPPEPAARLTRALLITLWLSFAYFGSIPSWNPNTRFDLVRALVENQTVVIDAFHKNTGDKSLFDGHYYSDKAPGLALLAVPVHYLRLQITQGDAGSLGGLYLATLTVVGGLSAVLVAAWFVLLRRLGAGASAALLMALAYGLATPAFPYSTLFFGHQAAAALLGLAFAIAVLRPGHRYWAAAAGVAMGFAFISEYPAAIGIAAILFYMAWRERAGGARAWLGILIWVAAGAALPLAIGAAYNTACFGAPWRIGYGTLVPSEFSTGMSRGLYGVTAPNPEAFWGITFGGKRGLFNLFPITLAAAAGLVRAAWRSQWQLEARVSLFVVLGFVWLNGSYAFWDGGASFGPRHIVPMLPFLMLGLLGLPRGRVWTAILVVVGLYSTVTAIAGTSVGADLPEYGHAMIDHVWVWIFDNQIPHERGAYNLGMMWGLTGVASLVPLFLFWLVTAPLLWLLSRAAGEAQAHA